MTKTNKPQRVSDSSQLACSAFVGKTVEDAILGRGKIMDETKNTVGVRFNKERRVMRVHYIPKTALMPNDSNQLEQIN